MKLILFLMVCYGHVNIVTSSKLFAPLRDFLEKRWTFAWMLVHCPMCFGFWAGVFWALTGLWPTSGMQLWWELLAAGCASSGWNWIVRVILHRLGEDEEF